MRRRNREKDFEMEERGNKERKKEVKRK